MSLTNTSIDEAVIRRYKQYCKANGLKIQSTFDLLITEYFSDCKLVGNYYICFPCPKIYAKSPLAVRISNDNKNLAKQYATAKDTPLNIYLNAILAFQLARKGWSVEKYDEANPTLLQMLVTLADENAKLRESNISFKEEIDVLKRELSRQTEKGIIQNDKK